MLIFSLISILLVVLALWDYYFNNGIMLDIRNKRDLVTACIALAVPLLNLLLFALAVRGKK